MGIKRKLLEYYEEILQEAKQLKFKKLVKFLDMKFALSGVCACALDQFNVSIYKKKWVLKYTPNGDGGYWASPPGAASTKKQALKALKIRIKILKKELS